MLFRSDEVPETPAGPQEVESNVHAADLLGAARVPTDWAVVSLCRTGDHFVNHALRRQLYLIDEEGPERNAAIASAVLDAVDSVDAFLADGRNVVVHCHGGRSRTGLVLKAWAMRRFGLDERARGIVAACVEPAALIGLFVGIPIATRLLQRDPGLVLKFIALVNAIVAALWVGFALAPNIVVAVTIAALTIALISITTPGIGASLSLATPPKVRSFGYAVAALWILQIGRAHV